MSPAEFNRLREERNCFYCPHIDRCNPVAGCRITYKPTKETFDKLKFKEL